MYVQGWDPKFLKWDFGMNTVFSLHLTGWDLGCLAGTRVPSRGQMRPNHHLRFRACSSSLCPQHPEKEAQLMRLLERLYLSTLGPTRQRGLCKGQTWARRREVSWLSTLQFVGRHIAFTHTCCCGPYLAGPLVVGRHGGECCLESGIGAGLGVTSEGAGEDLLAPALHHLG